MRPVGKRDDGDARRHRPDRVDLVCGQSARPRGSVVSVVSVSVGYATRTATWSRSILGRRVAEREVGQGLVDQVNSDNSAQRRRAARQAEAWVIFPLMRCLKRLRG